MALACHNESVLTINVRSNLGSTIDIGGGLRLSRRATAEVIDDNTGQTVTLEVLYDENLRRLVAERVTIERRGEGTEVTGTDLRAVRVQDYLAQAGFAMLQRLQPDGSYLAGTSLMKRGEILGAGKSGPKAEEIAARLYTTFSVVNLPPLKGIASTMNVSHSTATRLVANARKRGLIRHDG